MLTAEAAADKTRSVNKSEHSRKLRLYFVKFDLSLTFDPLDKKVTVDNF